MKRSVFVISAVALLCLLFSDLAKGHGMILNPAGRGSRWRFDNTAIQNFNDNGNNCGGFHTQFYVHDGKCGICGDSYGAAKPRAHELLGKYGGSGVIVQTYTKGSQPEIEFDITANHDGFVYYEICNLDKFGTESEECFKQYRLKFINGNDRHDIRAFGKHTTVVVLPKQLTCDHCILRWTYFAGNNWGVCEDGIGKTGCGNQETFKNCADIRITS